MTAIASGVIFAWPSTVASIPAGWSRKTALDGYYLKAAAASADADLVTARGNATHTHTSPSHTPTQNSHTHNFSAASGSGTATGGADSPNTFVPGNKHGHSSISSAATTATNNGIAITVDAATNSLPYIEAIFIESDGTPTGIPVGGLAFFESDTLPTSWTRAYGDKYLKGAAAAGDGGGTGGSASHSHTSPAHTHTQNSHTHSAVTSGDVNGGTLKEVDLSGGGMLVMDLHHHSVSLNTQTATNQSVTTTISSVNHEPVYKKINLISNGAAAADLPNSVVGIWGGTNATIPANWSRVTSLDDNFPKHANADGESLVTTGGGATHTHTASDCQPTQNSHTHTVTAGAGDTIADTTGTFALVTRLSPTNHTHTWTVTSTVATNQATAVSIDVSASEAAYPLYRTIILIKFTAPATAVDTHDGHRRKFYLPIYEEAKAQALNEVDKISEEEAEILSTRPTPNETQAQVQNIKAKSEALARKISELTKEAERLQALKDLREQLITLEALRRYQEFLMREEEALITLILQ